MQLVDTCCLHDNCKISLISLMRKDFKFHTHTHTHARTHARAHAHTHTHARTHARTHTHTRSCELLSLAPKLSSLGALNDSIRTPVSHRMFRSDSSGWGNRFRTCQQRLLVVAAPHCSWRGIELSSLSLGCSDLLCLCSENGQEDPG